MQILIGGDVCPQNRVIGRKGVFNNISSLFKDADYSIINLESPVKEEGAEPIEKRGPNLETPLEFLDELRDLGVNMVTLANNHFLDYGEGSAILTIDECRKRGIKTVGGGSNLNEASKIAYLTIKGSKLAIINCCEHEYSVATESSAGSNPLDLIDITRSIQTAKGNAQYVIVIVHGGIENFQLPSPRMKKTYRFFIDCGADAVLNHHQHCFSGFEVYNQKTIFYGLGNLCFDWPKQKRSWYEGMLVLLKFQKGGKISFTIKYYHQAKENVEPTLFDDDDTKRIENIQNKMNTIIQDESLLKGEYERLLNETDSNYDYLISPWSISYTLKLYKKGFLPNYFRRRKWLWLQNALTCESHYERFLHMIKTKLK